LFTARLRYTRLARPSEGGAALSGGLTPLIAAVLNGLERRKNWPVVVLPDPVRGDHRIATYSAPEMANKEWT